MVAALTSEQGAARVRRIVMIGCAINALLMAMKILTGYFGHSDALVADGFHSLNDFAADLIMLVFVGLSFRGADKRFSYGYGKFETFSSFLISSFLIVVAVMIGIEGVESIIDYSRGEMLPRPDIWTIIVVLISMLCKEGLYRFYSISGRRVGSQALVANAWHHRIDALASVATLIGVSFSHFFGETFRILDPCASIAIALFIFIPALRLLRPAFTELMEHSLPAGYTARIREVALRVEGVSDATITHSRKSGHNNLVEIRIAVSPALTVADFLQLSDRLTSALTAEFGPTLLPTILPVGLQLQ
jgi:cation diffusion facilitator family transporter